MKKAYVLLSVFCLILISCNLITYTITNEDGQKYSYDSKEEWEAAIAEIHATQQAELLEKYPPENSRLTIAYGNVNINDLESRIADIMMPTLNLSSGEVITAQTHGEAINIMQQIEGMEFPSGYRSICADPFSMTLMLSSWDYDNECLSGVIVIIE